MKFPNKINSYKESVICRFPVILDVLNDKDISVMDLYFETRQCFYDTSEFLDTINCLFALNILEYKEELGVLHYVG